MRDSLWLLLFFFSLLFFFFRFTLVLPSTDDSPFRRSFVFHFNFSSISILRSKWLFFKRYRSYTKKYRYFIRTIPFSFSNQLSLRFIHPLVSSFHTFSFHIPHPSLWCKFQSHLRPFFPLLCTCLQKKKKISVFLRRSLTFIFVPLSLLSIPTCALSLTHPPSLFPRDDVVGASHRKWRDAPGNFALTFIRM